MHYSILYRGPLSSCNYGCEYCPFAKRSETYAQLEGDRGALSRFVQWCGRAEVGDALSILFTPWGEALIRSWYQDAMAVLSQTPHVRKVAIQTNISCHLKWLDRCDLRKLALWCTYHPTETTRDRFLDRCVELDSRGVRYSVGIVGLQEHMNDAEWLRDRLNKNVYMWVNAYKRISSYYDESMLQTFEKIDPLFAINNTRHSSLGKSCRAGEEVFSVDGDGTMRRCHFIKQPIGSIYSADWKDCLRPMPCTAATCGCHIGYVHLCELGLYRVFKDGVLERIPCEPIWRVASKPEDVTQRRVALPQVSASG